MPARTIDDYRNRFKTAPLGRWSQAVGTFSGVMDELWEFKPDHTGSRIQTGPFGGKRAETRFEWKEVADFTIACQVTGEWQEDADEEDSEEEQEPEPENWVVIRYDFRTASTDFGGVTAMYQVPEDGSIKEGFWLSREPLMSTDRW